MRNGRPHPIYMYFKCIFCCHCRLLEINLFEIDRRGMWCLPLPPPYTIASHSQRKSIVCASASRLPSDFLFPISFTHSKSPVKFMPPTPHTNMRYSVWRIAYLSLSFQVCSSFAANVYLQTKRNIYTRHWNMKIKFNNTLRRYTTWFVHHTRREKKNNSNNNWK